MADFAKTDSPEKKKEEVTKKEEEKKDEEKPTAEGEEGEDDEDPEAAESTATFTPVVHLEAVETHSGEEDEEIVWKERAKLFVFGENMLDKGTGKKQWNEKGTGDIKILKHKETSHIRVLMRQEKTMKIIANHICDPNINLSPNATAAEKSWVWWAFDFSEGQKEEKFFCIRFKGPEQSQEFKAQFDKAQEAMKTVLGGKDSAEGAKEADDLAGALDKVEVKTKSPEKVKEPEVDPDL